MHTRLHRFLLLLLMLTLPMQAFAYSAMQASAFPDGRAAEGMAMAGGESMADCHWPDHPHTPAAQHECKFCAACSLASALPTEFAAGTPVVLIARGFASRPAASFSGFIPDGPERPPRPPLA